MEQEKCENQLHKMRYSKVSGYFEIFMCGLFFHLKKDSIKSFFSENFAIIKQLWIVVSVNLKGDFLNNNEPQKYGSKDTHLQ